MADLVALSHAAVGLSSVSALVVIVAALVAGAILKFSAFKDLKKIEDSLPKTIETVVKARIPLEALLALCDVSNMTAEELVKIYKEDALDREGIAKKLFGKENQVVKGYLKWAKTHSEFYKNGYAVEVALNEALAGIN